MSPVSQNLSRGAEGEELAWPHVSTDTGLSNTSSGAKLHLVMVGRLCDAVARESDEKDERPDS